MVEHSTREDSKSSSICAHALRSRNSFPNPSATTPLNANCSIVLRQRCITMPPAVDFVVPRVAPNPPQVSSPPIATHGSLCFSCSVFVVTKWMDLRIQCILA